MARIESLSIVAVLALTASPLSAAEPVMVQCGRDYQAAKTAGTLNGLDWTQYRTDCAARLKGEGAAAPATSPPPNSATPVIPIATPTAAPAPSGAMTAVHQRQKQCGAEWTSQKATLIAQTPGLTWPRYWSQCNTRLKSAGH